MQNVSQAYKQQIRHVIRNPSYLKVSYGVYSLPATEQAKFESSDQTNYSQLELKDDDLPQASYATFEHNRMKVGGPQVILPEQSPYRYQGYVSDTVSGVDGLFSPIPTIKITFDDPQDVYGLTLLFDPVERTYPKRISINGTEFKVSGTEFVASEKMYSVESITIQFLESYKPQWRARLAQVLFGQSVIFDNYTIEDSTYTSKVDLVSGELSSKKFTFKVDNHNQIYNPLNPQGLTEFIDEKQPVKIEYGYELDDGTIEWMLGDNLVLEGTPKTGDYDVTFTAVDTLSDLTGTYYKGQFYDNGITLFDLAELVLADAGVETDDYVLDERLKTIKTYGALPIVTHRECLQIIANAGQSILFTNRNGQIEIKTALDPVITISDNNHLYYSDAVGAFNDGVLPTVKYAEYLPNTMRIGQENKVILPTDSSKIERQGYISEVYGNSNGEFTDIVPTYIISYSFAYSTFAMPITFDSIEGEYAVDFDVAYFLDDEEVDRLEVRGNEDVVYDLQYDVSSMNRIEIQIKKWSAPYHRARIDLVGEGRINDMRIDFDTAKKRPTVTKKELTKTVEVLAYNYYPATEKTDIVKQKFTGTGTITLRLQHEAADDITASVTKGSITSQTHYAYMSEITLQADEETELTLSGYKVQTNSVSVIKQVNPRGTDKTPITNPLITDIGVANTQAIWIADYYQKRNQLKVDYRGNPEIDAYDTIYFESQFEPTFPVRVQESKITFAGSLGGSLTVVKI